MDTWRKTTSCWFAGSFPYVCKDYHWRTPFCRFFTLSPVTNTRGHSAKVLKNRCSLDLRRFFFSERVVDQWNSLPQHTRTWLTLEASTRLRMVSILWEEIRWASLRTDLVRLALRPHMFLRILWNRCGRTWYVTWYVISLTFQASWLRKVETRHKLIQLFIEKYNAAGLYSWSELRNQQTKLQKTWRATRAVARRPTCR